MNELPHILNPAIIFLIQKMQYFRINENHYLQGRRQIHRT
jgi:hypothetical protein